MTCGINLGLLLVGLFQAVHVCCSWTVDEGKGPHAHVGPSYVHDRPDGSSRPQDEFRQAYVVKNSIPPSDFNHGPSHPQFTHTASLSRHQAYPSVRHFHSSLPQSQWLGVDSSRGNVPLKPAFGLSPVASGSSVSKHDSPNHHNDVGRTWPGQGTGRTGQYAAGKSDFRSPSKGSYLFSSGSHLRPAAWEPHSGAKMHQKPDTSAQLTGLNNDDLTPPKEYIQQTSGVARGRKVNSNNGHRKPVSTQYSEILGTESNPIINNLRERYEIPVSRRFGLSQSHQVSAYNQNPPLQTASNHGAVHMRGYDSGRLGPGQRFAPTKVHHIPYRFGGHPIKRLGDEELMVQTATHTPMVWRPKTERPTRAYTFPPRHTQSYRPQQPSIHHKSKWMRIRSNQLAGAAGVLG